MLTIGKSTLQIPKVMANDWKRAIVPIGLLLVGLISRWIFMSRVLYHWDSVNFAFSLDTFDVAAGQPHIPGYILYVFFMRGVNLFFKDPQLSMVIVSVIASAFAVVQLYRLGTLILNKQAGFLAALFLASSPLFWFYGEIALPHALDALMILISIEILFRLDQGNTSLAIFAAVWLGIVGGFRPQTEVFMMPLAIFAGRKLGWKRLLSLTGILIITNLTWFIPLLISAGGLLAYWHVFQSFYLSFNTATSVVSGGGLNGIIRNLRKLIEYTLYGVGFTGLLLIPAFLKQVRHLLDRKQVELDPRWSFLLLWITPSLIYYTFIHMGQQGLVFVFLPALLLITAWGYVSLGISRAAVRLTIAGGLVLANSLLFILAPSYPLGTDQVKLLTADTIKEHDQTYLERIMIVENHFDPQHTILIAAEWRFLQYYLPQYSYLPYELNARGEASAGQPTTTESQAISCPAAINTQSGQIACQVVIFDGALTPWILASARIKTLEMPSGSEMLFLDLFSGDELHLGPEGISVISPSSHPG